MSKRKNVHNDKLVSSLEELEHNEMKIKEDKGLGNDLKNVFLLLFLYILQGIPLGLAGSIPMILQQHNVSYKDQATFSLAFWPFSLKLLWAPIVDSCYFKWMGRRKSWLIPSQYLIGIFMLGLSRSIDFLLEKEEGQTTPHIFLITSVFFALNFLAATQDIAVDGWALTILSKRNLGWASTCNTVGQTTGYCLGYVVFLALESKDFCMNYLGLQDSLVTLAGFFFFWGIVFMLMTTIVWIMKSERDEASLKGEVDLGMFETYSVVMKMVRMPAVRNNLLVLLTAKIGFAASDSLTVLKLTENGVPKEQLALLSIPLTPLTILLPLYISKFTTGPKPMNVYLKAYIPRLLFGLVFAMFVWITPYFKDATGHFSASFYITLVCIYFIHQISANCMYVALMAFHAQVSDETIGGTCMTLFNTFTNLGGNWPSWVALRYVSELTWSTCVAGAAMKDKAEDVVSETVNTVIGVCSSPDDILKCEKSGGTCHTQLDGFYLESVIFIIFGLIWYQWGSKMIRSLQSLPKSAWRVVR